MKYRPGFINPPFEYKVFRVKESTPTRESSVFLGKNYFSELTGKEVEEALVSVGDKQDKLVSGTNIKTINEESLLGEGNLVISGGESEINDETVALDSTWSSEKIDETKATVGWVDVDFPIIIRTTGGARPILAEVVTDITAPQWAVGNWVQLEDQEIVHAYKEGSDWVWHVHLITNGTNVNDRYVRFEVKWIWANANDQFSEVITSTSEDMLIPANTPDRTHLIRNIKTHEMPTAKIGAHVLSRLERVAADGTAPTGNPFCSLLQIHVECDTLGSSQITSK
jgi:hypothetical protein